jgi:hypothetical protein
MPTKRNLQDATVLSLKLKVVERLIEFLEVADLELLKAIFLIAQSCIRSSPQRTSARIVEVVGPLVKPAPSQSLIADDLDRLKKQQNKERLESWTKLKEDQINSMEKLGSIVQKVHNTGGTNQDWMDYVHEYLRTMTLQEQVPPRARRNRSGSATSAKASQSRSRFRWAG